MNRQPLTTECQLCGKKWSQLVQPAAPGADVCEKCANEWRNALEDAEPASDD